MAATALSTLHPEQMTPPPQSFATSSRGGLSEETSLPHWNQMACKALSIRDILGLATPDKE